MPSMPRHSSCFAGMAPRPMSVVTIGMAVALGKLAQLGRRAGRDHAAANIKQRPLALRKRLKKLGALSRRDARFSPPSADDRSSRETATCLAHGTDRPVLDVLRHIHDDRPRTCRAGDFECGSAVSVPASSGSVTRNTCFAHADMMLKTGASWKASLPIAARGTCPQMSTTGIESPLQSAIGVTAFVAPGPMSP